MENLDIISFLDIYIIDYIIMKTEDNYEISIDETLAEVGQYANKQWYIRPHKVSKENAMFSSSKYFKNYELGYKYYKSKKAPTN